MRKILVLDVGFGTCFEGYGDIDVNYTFHRSGQDDEEGTITNGNTVTCCIDSNKCNIMARHKTGITHFFYFENNEGLISPRHLEIVNLIVLRILFPF